MSEETSLAVAETPSYDGSVDLQIMEKASYEPARAATELIEMIHTIEQAIEGSEDAIREIEGRGFFKNVFRNRTKDLVNISRSQNTINGLFLGLVREIIMLNVMSYSYLAAIVHEFEQMVRNGWRDQEGRLQTLSDGGQELATVAGEIFHTILHGSRETHMKIEQSELQIQGLKVEQAAFAQKHAELERDVKRLQSQSRTRGWLLSALTAFAVVLIAALAFT